MPTKTTSSSLVQSPRDARRARAEATSGAIGTERTFPDFGVVRTPSV